MHVHARILIFTPSKTLSHHSNTEGKCVCVCVRACVCVCDVETVGGEARSPSKIAITWRVYVYFAHNGALKSVGKTGLGSRGCE
jgi:hypothetical protein